MTDADVYQTAGNEVEVDIDGRTIRFAYNPDTGYVLVPASIYGAEPETMTALRNADFINGIFNHEALSKL